MLVEYDTEFIDPEGFIESQYPYEGVTLGDIIEYHINNGLNLVSEMLRDKCVVGLDKTTDNFDLDQAVNVAASKLGFSINHRYILGRQKRSHKDPVEDIEKNNHYLVNLHHVPFSLTVKFKYNSENDFYVIETHKLSRSNLLIPVLAVKISEELENIFVNREYDQIKKDIQKYGLEDATRMHCLRIGQ